jgi:hypothetical protein
MALRDSTSVAGSRESNRSNPTSRAWPARAEPGLAETASVEGGIADLQREPLFEQHGGETAVHYVIVTEDDVVEVVSKDVPRVRSLGTAPPSDRA